MQISGIFSKIKMPKIIGGLMLCACTFCNSVYATTILPTTCSKCDQSLMPGGYWNGTEYDTCEEMCRAIKSHGITDSSATGDPNEYGVYVYQTYTYTETCGEYEETSTGHLIGRLGSCYSVAKDNYKCGKGYYGTATSETSGCKKCPANANCNTGESRFYCNPGYYQSGLSCAKCPNPTTGSGDEGNWTVSSSARVGGGDPLPFVASGGATSIGQCYLANTSVVTDTAGTYEITGATGAPSGIIIDPSDPGKWCDYYGRY